MSTTIYRLWPLAHSKLAQFLWQPKKLFWKQAHQCNQNFVWKPTDKISCAIVHKCFSKYEWRNSHMLDSNLMWGINKKYPELTTFKIHQFSYNRHWQFWSVLYSLNEIKMDQFWASFIAFICSIQLVVGTVDINSACFLGPTPFGPTLTSSGTYQLKYMEPVDLINMNSGNTVNVKDFFETK